MSPSLFTSSFLALLALLTATDPKPPAAPQGKREPVPPATAVTPDALKYDLSQTKIEWVEGLEGALGRGKPILLFQLLGRFDDAMC